MQDWEQGVWYVRRKRLNRKPCLEKGFRRDGVATEQREAAH